MLNPDRGHKEADALTARDLDEIKRVPGLPLPEDVRTQYGISNGLLGPTDCQLLYTWRQAPESAILQNTPGGDGD